MTSLRQNTTAAFFAIAIVAPVAWMLLDRDPPHIRTAGEIVAATPEDCAQADNAPAGAIYPGSCVRVNWTIEPNRPVACPPSSEFNVSRIVISSKGRQWSIGPVVGALATKRDAELSRYFVLPSDMAYGPSKYRAIACFACNPLHKLWPVCVDKPEIEFEVVKPHGYTK